MAIRRLIGANMGVVYGEAGDPPNPTTRMTNCYQAEVSFDSGEIDTTAFDDYPWGTAEPGFIDVSITLGMRNAAGAADVDFLDAAVESREPFSIGVIENAQASTPTVKWKFNVVAMSMKGGGEVKGAQDKSYTLKRVSWAN